MAPIVDIPGLPRVLIIGDSISIGYTLQVRELLKGKANVHRVPQNCGATNKGFARTKEKSTWGLDQPWDVIHYNFGIWDTKIRPNTGKVTTSDEAYIKNLTAITERLKETGAELIFATTTPIPDNLLVAAAPDAKLPQKSRVFLDVTEKNQLAVKSLSPMGVQINDLYTVVYPQREACWRPQDLHFNPHGCDVLAEAVATSISDALDKRQNSQP